MFSEEKKEVKEAISINPIPKKEIIIALIDTVENYLDEKGITKDMIANDERDTDDETAAIIYGSDYDYLYDKFERILNRGEINE